MTQTDVPAVKCSRMRQTHGESESHCTIMRSQWRLRRNDHRAYSTVTLLARFRGLSTSHLRATAM